MKEITLPKNLYGKFKWHNTNINVVNIELSYEYSNLKLEGIHGFHVNRGNHAM